MSQVDRTRVAMTLVERRAAASLGGIYALRMFGLFMILPVFALYAERLHGVTPLLAGLAISIYGLTQGLLQIPLGMLSDRVGRKPVILAGLAVFAIGSVVAAQADTIQGVILGRALQGGGAIAAAVMALAADLTREEHRTRIMAVIGASIGLAFVLAMVAGPVLSVWIGVDGLFWMTAVLALCGMAAVVLVVPTPVRSELHRDTQTVPRQIRAVIGDGQLLRLDTGIFSLHLILTAGFVVLPLALRDSAGLDPTRHWQLYLSVLLISVLAMIPLILQAERKGRMKQMFVLAVAVLALSQGLLAVSLHSLWSIVAALVVFFTAFNFLEASLPSLISRVAPADSKGTAMGVYSSSQFLGAFVGGTMGGWLHGELGPSGVFWFCTVVALGWLLFAASMRAPRNLRSYLLRVGDVDEQGARRLVLGLSQVPGVAEAVVVAEDGIAYLKVDSQSLDEATLMAFSAEDVTPAVATGN